MTTPTGALFYYPLAKPLSTAGQFQPGCYLLFYQTGTTTPANVYAEGYLVTALNQTPGAGYPSTTADGAGQFQPIYMDPSVIYRVQAYTAGGVLMPGGDIDPYIPLPIPASIAAIQSNIATLQSQITAINGEIASLQATYPWANLTGIPTPVAALAASTPGGVNTFWRGDNTWAAPSATGAAVTQSLVADIAGIGSSFTTVINAIPVTAGQTYAMLFEGDVVSAGGAGTLNTQMAPNSGVLTATGGALGFILQTASGAYQQTSQNAATPGITNAMYANIDNYCRFYGRFSVPAGCTSVSFQIRTPSGSLTAKAGSYCTLTQIS